MHASRSDHAVPPIEIDTLVPCAPDLAFDYFTRDVGRWWPLSRYSCSQERAASVQFDDGKLVHSGWERLGAKAADARASYAGGWPTVLGTLYKKYCEGAA